MTFDWYSLFNLQEFLDTGLVSRVLSVTLTGIGDAEIVIVRANQVSILYDGVLLPVEFAEENPYVFDGYAVYRGDDDTIWLGIPVEEEQA